MIEMIGRVPALSSEQTSRCMDLAVSGVIGYYGRSTPITWEDCEQIETVRARVVRQRGFAPGVPKLQVYASYEMGGLEHMHAYMVAAAALCDQIDRALCGGEGEPARAATEAHIAATCFRLGCRQVHPLVWRPDHLTESLDPHMSIEAWLLAKARTGLMGMETGAGLAEGPLARRTWEELTGRDRRAQGPLLWEGDGREGWEGEGCVFSKRLAALGMTYWSDMTDLHTGHPVRP